MKKWQIMKTVAFFAAFCFALCCNADDWNTIKSSGNYYYGDATGICESEAKAAAIDDMISRIAINVSNDFTQIEESTNTNGAVNHASKVQSCLKTYSGTALTNAEFDSETLSDGKIRVRCWIKRSELHMIYKSREERARQLVALSERQLAALRIDLSLQNLYQAYTLIRSVQYPNMVKDEHGHVLIDWIKNRIEEILSEVDVAFDKKDGYNVDLFFTYKKQPVETISFTYYDGNSDQCTGDAKDGRGTINLSDQYAGDTYNLCIEYEFKNLTNNDAELESVFNLIGKKYFAQAQKKVKAVSGGKAKSAARILSEKEAAAPKPQSTQSAANPSDYADIISQVITAISQRDNRQIINQFTDDGYQKFQKLISYGKGRVLANSNIAYYKGADGHSVVARGLQMSFSFNTGTKRTFVETVNFTFNEDKKIDNVAFGIGNKAENDILFRDAPRFSEQSREMLLEFMENYKTAYSLKDMHYIKSIFADDATIIIGHVAKVTDKVSAAHEKLLTIDGKEKITYNKYSKSQYLDNLRRCFNANEFINLHFTHNEVQILEKFKDKELYAIQIGQEYNSSRYADKGYLFLMIDMTDHEAPLINIRTWQPQKTPIGDIYNAGSFY